MRIAAVIVILLCLFSVCSCGSGSKMDARFQEIDRLTDSLPHEAIRSLDSINTAGLSEIELNRYRLLWIKSRDKAYIAHTSDTLILDVIEKDQYPWPTLVDLDDEFHVFELHGATSSAVFLIDPEGKIVFSDIGPDEVKKALDSCLY